ncbi:hypothetical protein FHT67_005291 [Paenibacillus sp. BK720]|nr:hypothetical protein [Paenibacillus sp. BK720]
MNSHSHSMDAAIQNIQTGMRKEKAWSAVRPQTFMNSCLSGQLGDNRFGKTVGPADP